MYQNFFYIKGDKLIRDSFSDATAIGFRMYLPQYGKAFKTPLPDWFKIGLPMHEKTSLLKKAVESGNAISTEPPFEFKIPMGGLSLPNDDPGFIPPVAGQNP